MTTPDIESGEPAISHARGWRAAHVIRPTRACMLGIARWPTGEGSRCVPVRRLAADLARRSSTARETMPAAVVRSFRGVATARPTTS
jgi:hypothetical protein